MLPPIEHRFPRCSIVHRWAGALFLRATGWKLVGGAPNLAKAVVIAAPHTSNWDLVFGMAGAWELGIGWSWFGKDSLFKPPLGPLIRWIGGIPVDRSAPNGLVGEAVAWFGKRDALFLAVPAEGTRSYAPYWRSGFYWMAVEAKVPIVLGFVDFGRKEVGLGGPVIPTGDVKRDMEQIRAFYATKTAAYPELMGPIRLKAEDEAPPPA